MVNLDFTVIGVNDVTDDPTIRFRCVASDGDKLYIGTDRSSEGSADIWEYSNGSYTKITDTLEDKSFKSIGDLIVDDGVLYAGVGDGFDTQNTYSGQVWVNNSLKWSEIGLGAGSAVNYGTNFIRSMVKVGDDIYAGGSKYDLFKISSSGFTPVLTFNTNFSASMPPGYRTEDNFSKLENWVDLETDGSAVYGSIIPTSSVQALMAYVDNSILNLSSIVKYDPVANTLVDFSPPLVFVNGGHRMVSKLHYDDGYLYAGTLNAYSGTEVWRSPVDSGGSWTQINDDGFGDVTNFLTTDIQTVEGHIVVSVTSSKGSSIWVYDKSDGSWTKQTITSDIIYETYRIQRLGTVNYLVGQNPQYMVQTRPEETIMEAEEMYQELIPHLMDNTLHAFPLEDGNYRFIGNQGPKILVTEGTLQDPFSTKISPLNDMTSAIDASARTWCSPYDQYNIGASSSNFSSMYFTELQDKKLSFTRSKMADPASDLLNGSGYQFRVEDDLGNFLENVPASAVANYAGLNSYINENHSGITLYHPNGLMYDEDEDLLIGTLYCEDGKWGKAGPPSSNPVDGCGKDEQYWLRSGWYHTRSLRLIASNDKGVTFSDCGSLVTSPSGARITPNDVTSPSSAENAVVGVGNGSFIRRADPDTGEDYLYVYFIRFRSSLDGPEQGFGAARAPYSSVIDYALNGSAYPFSAYYEGSWDQVVTSERLTNGSSTDLFPSNTYLREVAPFGYIDNGAPYLHKESNHVAMAGLSPVHIVDAYLATADVRSYQTAYYSKDGINFGYPQRLNNSEPEFRSDGINIITHKYPGFVGPDTYKGEWGDTVETYGLGYTNDYGSYPILDTFWQTGRIRSTSLSSPSIESTDRSFDVGRYIRAFNSKYAIDRGQLPGIYAAMHRIGENKKLLNSRVAIDAATSSLEVYLSSLVLARSFEEEDPDDFAALTAEINRIQALLDGDYRSFTASASNNNTEGYTFPASIEDYYNFEFGRDLHRLYHIYHENFAWHRLSPEVQKQGGANIFSHTFGPLLYNHNFETLGSSIDLVASSFANPDKISVTSVPFTGVGSFSRGSLSSMVYASATSSYVPTITSERVSPIIVDGVELVLTSGTEADSSFSIMKVPGSQRASYEDSYLYDKTLVLMRSGNDAATRVRFDISRYAADSTHPIPNNFLSPNHKFKVNLKSLIGRDDGSTIGGRSVGVWIHTNPERDKIWSFTPDGEWVQHDRYVTRQEMFTKYAHTKEIAAESRDPNSFNSSSTTNFECLDQVTSNRTSPVIGLSEDDFNEFEIVFDTHNRNIILPFDYRGYYSQLHRLDQEYVIEIFMSPGAQPDQFMLVESLTVQDLTMKKLSEIFAAGTKSNPLCVLDDPRIGCQEYRVELTKQDLFDVFKHFNNIAGKNTATAYAGRDKDKTETIMESEGGSRIDYRLPNELLFNVTDAGSYYTQVIIQV
jgi:hypothetical protein